MAPDCTAETASVSPYLKPLGMDTFFVPGLLGLLGLLLPASFSRPQDEGSRQRCSPAATCA